ncbi:MAG: response regulator, partial [Bacteroidia bacterium]|nr:response regulator [Bacteroidia bacterium]
MRIVIVEDEQPAARRLKKMLEEAYPEIEVVATLDSVEATVQWLQKEGMPDLIFMDIMLADGLSFDIFQQIQVKSPVIFTTSYDEYALQ